MLSIEIIAPQRLGTTVQTFKGKANKLQRAAMQHRKEAIEQRFISPIDRGNEQRDGRRAKR